MNTTETITWHPASEPPDTPRKVQIVTADADCAFLGYHDSARISWRKWCNAEGFPMDAPMWWAELPRGPQG